MNEQISALIDDEIAVEEAVHLIIAMQSNKQSAEAWSQYHLIGDAMRGNVAFNSDFKQNLMRKIELEPTVLAPHVTQTDSKIMAEIKGKLPATWSIAASFAAVMAVGWMAMHQQVQSGNDVPSIEVAKADIAEQVAPEQAIPNEYLMAHRASVPSTSSYYIQSVNYAE